MKLNQLNCIIIHGCPSNKKNGVDPKKRTYDKHWIPWTKRELIKNNIPTETPLMPSPWEPKYSDYKKEFEKYTVNEDTVLVGHSCGCSFLVRWLGESKNRIAKLILVAPWKIAKEEDEIKQAFYEFPIDKTIKDRVKKIVMFTADDEAEDGKKGLKMFHESLGGKIVNLKNHGHYCLNNMGTEEFPELIKEIIGD